MENSGETDINLKPPITDGGEKKPVPIGHLPEKPNASKKEPWQITREEFIENYYLHGTPEENLPGIIKAGGITRGSFIKAAYDAWNAPVAYATDSEESVGGFTRSGRGIKKGVILVAELDDIISPKQKEAMSRERLRSGSATENPDGVSINEYKRAIGKYKAIIPIDVDPHKYLIEQAIEKGKKIPQEVLKDYPDIALKLGIKLPPSDTTGPDYQWGSVSFRQARLNPEICTTEKLEYWLEQFLKRFQGTNKDNSREIKAFINELEYRAKNNGKNKRNWQFETPKKEFAF